VYGAGFLLGMFISVRDLKGGCFFSLVEVWVLVFFCECDFVGVTWVKYEIYFLGRGV